LFSFPVAARIVTPALVAYVMAASVDGSLEMAAPRLMLMTWAPLSAAW
jgi:hypothetical protein